MSNAEATDGSLVPSATRTTKAGLLAVAAVAFLLVVVPGSAEASTTITDSTITSDTFWGAGGSPYILETTVTVADSDAPVLTIESGVEVRFDPGTRLKIGNSTDPGALEANGSASEPIRFTSEATDPAPGDHRGLSFGSAGAPSSFLKNASLRYSGDSGAPGMLVDDHDLTVDKVNVSENADDGIQLVNADVPLQEIDLWNNGGNGLLLDTSSPTVWDSTISDSGAYGIDTTSDSSVPSLDNVHVQNSGNAPLRVPAGTDLSTTTLGPESTERIELRGTTLTSNATIPLLTDAEDGNEFTYTLLTDLTVAGGATLTVEPGTRLEVGANDALSFGQCCGDFGNLDAQGTAADPITLTSTAPNQEWGRFLAQDGTSSSSFTLRNATVENLRRIQLDDRPNAELDNVTVQHASSEGLDVTSSTLDLRNVAINDTRGLLMDGSSTATLNSVTVENVTQANGVQLFGTTVSWHGGRIADTPDHGIEPSGCDDVTLSNVTIEHTGKYGVFVRQSCGNADLHNVRINDTAHRAWRNSIGAAYDNVTLENIGIHEVDYWGTTLTSDLTLPQHTTKSGDDLTPRLFSSLTVAGGATFTIQPGTRLEVGANDALSFGQCCGDFGNLDAQGTAADPITLTSTAPNQEWGRFLAQDGTSSSSFTLRNATVENLRRIQLDDRPDATLDNVTVDHASSEGLDVTSSTLDLRNVAINDTRGLLMDGSSTATLNSVTVENVTQANGVQLFGTTVSWHGGRIADTPDHGIEPGSCDDVTLSNVTVEHTGKYGVFVSDACGNADLHDVTINDTAHRAWRNSIGAAYDNVTLENIGIHEVDYWGTTLTSDLTLPQHTTKSGDDLTPRLFSDLTVAGGATFTIQPGTRLEIGGNDGLQFGQCCGDFGNLDAQGTQAEPITLTSMSSSSHWRRLLTEEGTSSSSFTLRNTTVERLSRVQINDRPNARLDNVTIEHADDHGLQIGGSTVEARNVAINDSEGIRMRFSSTGAFTNVTVENVTQNDGVLAASSSLSWEGGRIADTPAQGLRSRDSTLTVHDLSVRSAGGDAFSIDNSDGAELKGVEASGAVTGLLLDETDGATVQDSRFTGNDLGIRIQSDATGNLVYNNVFNNTQNADDDASNTRWNVTPTELEDDTNILGGHWLGGNFFHNYTGEDTDHDGLGDTQTPYTKGISGTGDEHPLVRIGPIDLEAVPGTEAGSIDLAWTASIPPAETYHIERATTSGGPYTEIATTSDVNYTDAGLEDDQTYYYVVTAEFSDGSTSEPTNEASSEPRPPAPEGLAAAPGTETGSIDLDWDPPSGTSTAFTYHVKRATTSGGPYTEIATTTDLNHTDPDLSPGTYYYVVTAEDDGVESPLSTEVSAQPAQPDPPLAVRVTAGEQANALQLDWQPPADEGSSLTYNVKRATNSGGPYTEVATTTDLHYTDTGLDDRTYYYVVTAETAGGLTSEDSQADGAHPRPSAPLNVQAQQGLEAGSIQVDWDPPGEGSGSLTYHVYRSTKDGGPYERIAGTDTTRYTDTGLAEGTYHYVVTAVDEAGLESPTSPQASAPSGGPTDVPEDTDEAQNDAGTGGDASDDPADPTILAGGKLIRINGTLISQVDPLDAYGTNISPNATISMRFNFTSPATMELEATLIAPDGRIVDHDQAPAEGGSVEVGAVADEGEHLEAGVWVTVLQHGLAPPLAPAGSPLGPETPAAAPPGSPVGPQPAVLEAVTLAPDDGTVPDLVPDRFTFIDYRDERPCDPKC